ncbi:TetR/AcrR family transcriptional regulator [Streptomyces heilongjiangensis]|uniref:TetR/AcrR family transcriptional regulator n=1 Tax=Streptomyces heilongjiangensis TaxID=945052 RepID=A0ABW1BFS6_9ACTN|nr:TetR/AcrR family transcriptional regulator [Streptomyces heilongjiangensis]MDC2950463.1 TetR/AcrR family transcriptional regulator [Streptomyces heilongjiangensis]
MTRGTRAEQRERTRQALVREGRRLFATLGYGAVGLSEIVRAAGVTKGALYHHFSSKAELFRAVLEQVQEEVAERIAETADAREDTWEQLVSGCQAFLTVSTDPALQRIMLVDGPAVLGWSEWRAMNETTSGRHLAQVLGDLIEEGTIAAQPVEPLTHLLSGAMNEAALWLAASKDPGDLDDTQNALVAMLRALRVT